MKKSDIVDLSYVAYMGSEHTKETLDLLTVQLSGIITLLVHIDPVQCDGILKQITTQVSAEEIKKQITLMAAHRNDYTAKMMAHLEATGFEFEPEGEGEVKA